MPVPTRPSRSPRRRTALLTASLLAAAPLVLVASPAAEATVYPSPTEPGLHYSVPAEVVVGSDIVVSGTGWLKTAGGVEGSVVAAKLDAAYSGDPATVYTKLAVTDPVSGTAVANKTIVAVVKANAAGDWTMRIPFPTADNAELADHTWTDWTGGSTHEVRFLTGSMLAGDPIRSLAGSFTVKTGSTTTATLSASSVSYGGAASVRVALGGVASGPVTVAVDGRPIATQTIAGAGTVALPRTLAVGRHSVTASYAGTAAVAASTTSKTLTVAKATPVVTLRLAKAKVKRSKAARARVVVAIPGAPAGVYATGQVVIRDGAKKLKAVRLTLGAKGQLVVKLPKIKKLGKHKLSVRYVGNANVNAQASRKVALKVVK